MKKQLLTTAILILAMLGMYACDYDIPNMPNDPVLWRTDTTWITDTTFVIDTTWVADTTFVIDTTWINDTTFVIDTTWVIDTIWVRDTTWVIDTIWIADTLWVGEVPIPSALQFEFLDDSTSVWLFWYYEEYVDYFECWEKNTLIDTIHGPDIILENLERGVLYQFRIRSIRNNTFSEFSEICEVCIPLLSGEGYSPGEERDFPLGNSGELITMCWIPPGSFDMGSPDVSFANPVHRVTFAEGFWMGKYEVTQQQWEVVIGNNPAHDYGVGNNYPAYYVSWNDIQDFESRLDDEFRLPSEAEWEYACRAGTTTRFYWGDDPDFTEIGDYAWYIGNYNATIHPVGQKTANAWGLYDMSGNVEEHCEDWWHMNYAEAPDNGTAWIFPPETRRIIRGGRFAWTALDCRSACRVGNDPTYRYIAGFRLVRNSFLEHEPEPEPEWQTTYETNFDEIDNTWHGNRELNNQVSYSPETSMKIVESNAGHNARIYYIFEENTSPNRKAIAIDFWVNISFEGHCNIHFILREDNGVGIRFYIRTYSNNMLIYEGQDIIEFSQGWMHLRLCFTEVHKERGKINVSIFLNDEIILSRNFMELLNWVFNQWEIQTNSANGGFPRHNVYIDDFKIETLEYQ